MKIQIVIVLISFISYTKLQGSGNVSRHNCLKLDDHGNCTCCKTGYRGRMCSEICARCSARLVSETKCSYSCTNGSYGEQCDKTCPTTCADGVKIPNFCKEMKGVLVCVYGCISGYYGQECNQSCNSNCLGMLCIQSNGRCMNCNENHYGDFCNFTCSQGCKGCNRTGHCSEGCKDGYYGDTCASRCGSNCMKDRCTSDKYSTYDCIEGCQDGYLGKNCSEICPENCKKCNQQSGICTICVEDYVFTNEKKGCEKEKELELTGVNISLVIAITTTTVTVISVVLVVVIVVIKKRRSAQKKRTEESNSLLDKSKGEVKCKKCHTVKQMWQSQKLFFVHHITMHDYMKTKEKELTKEKLLKEMAKFGAALRNTGGGEILLHIEDRYLVDLYNSLRTRLKKLIDDNSSYDDVYKRSRMSDVDQRRYGQYTDFVVIKVKKTRGVATVHFNTKIREGVKNKTPVTSDLVPFLRDSSAPTAPRRTCSELNEENIQRSVETELRHLPREKTREKSFGNIESLVDYIWSDLKLKKYLSSMSKLHNGGSYYVQIEDIVAVTGSGNLTEREAISEFENTLKKKIEEEVCILQRHPSDIHFADYVEVKTNKIDKKIICEVAISQVDGIVFYDKEGPLTYEIHTKEGITQTKRMNKYKWLERMVSLT